MRWELWLYNTQNLLLLDNKKPYNSDGTVNRKVNHKLSARLEIPDFISDTPKYKAVVFFFPIYFVFLVFLKCRKKLRSRHQRVPAGIVHQWRHLRRRHQRLSMRVYAGFQVR